MHKSHNITMLGTGFIGMFYTMTLQGQRRRDRVVNVYSNDDEEARAFAKEWNIPRSTTNMAEAINDPESDVVVIGLPNFLHEEAAILAAKAKKPVLCTKPLGRNAAEAKRMLEAVENAGIFHGYLEDLVYTPKVLKTVDAVRKGAVGKVLWTRSREAHPGPHSAWFWDKKYQKSRRAAHPGNEAPSTQLLAFATFPHWKDGSRLSSRRELSIVGSCSNLAPAQGV